MQDHLGSHSILVRERVTLPTFNCPHCKCTIMVMATLIGILYGVETRRQTERVLWLFVSAPTLTFLHSGSVFRFRDQWRKTRKTQRVSCTNVVSMLIQHLWCWTSIETTLDQRLRVSTLGLFPWRIALAPKSLHNRTSLLWFYLWKWPWPLSFSPS